ncbi:MAG: ABC transporter ATP-binding protein [Rubrivivax sp.]|nr:ABC transporter ATP-binding protein [Rubrivivax sp.]
MSRIELRGVAKAFGGTPVLRGLDLVVEPGELAVFVGPSGCGKSTLLRLLAGLEDVDAGEMRFDGRRVEALPPVERGVAMVFQSYALYPHMTVRENIVFGLRQRGLAADEVERRLAEALRLLELGELAARRPKELSGGQRQRVAIARAIVRRPRVFLLDEPLSNLDAGLRVQTRLAIARLHREAAAGGDGASMVYVTHDQVEAMTLADRVVLLQPLAGRPADAASVAQAGPPLELYHHPANRFVAGFIGSPAMNFVDAVVHATGPHGLQLQALGAVCDARVEAGDVSHGEAVTLGIRPEHVRLGEGPHRAAVEHVERLGELSLVYLRRPAAAGAGPPLLAKTPREDIARGDPLPFALPAEALHVFRADGRALRRTAGAGRRS